MNCSNCGKKIPEDAKYCEFCGEKTEQPELSVKHAAAENAQVKISAAGGSGDIRLCPDGKYRWYYEYRMMKNPTVLFTVWKVMMLAALFPVIVVLFSELHNGVLSAVRQSLLVFGIVFGALFVLSGVGYFILAAIYGFQYIVLFEMDEKGITHAQQEKQYKKAQAISWLTVIGGAAAGKPGTMGTGILAGTKQKITSEFKNVSSVTGMKKRNTIKVNQRFAKNQVYVKSEDYDFVWKYITSRCKKADIK